MRSSNPVGPGEVRASFMRAAFWAAELLNLRTLGLRLGNLSLHSTLLQAGAQHSQSPVEAEEGR